MPYERKQRAIIRGLTILGDAGFWGVDAQHDILLAGPGMSDEKQLPPQQHKELVDLGWFQSEENDCWGYFT